MKVNQADYPITTMCRLLGVSTSGYYAWVDRGPSTRDEANVRLLETINGIHQQSRRTYGAPRITAELREEGHLVGKNRVARLMKVAGIRPSMGSVGDCYDNALCESFFASLECELIDRHSFRSKLQARLAVFDYIEGFYNPHRRHSSLDYLSPINYESRHSDVA